MADRRALAVAMTDRRPQLVVIAAPRPQLMLRAAPHPEPPGGRNQHRGHHAGQDDAAQHPLAPRRRQPGMLRRHEGLHASTVAHPRPFRQPPGRTVGAHARTLRFRGSMPWGRGRRTVPGRAARTPRPHADACQRPPLQGDQGTRPSHSEEIARHAIAGAASVIVPIVAPLASIAQTSTTRGPALPSVVGKRGPLRCRRRSPGAIWARSFAWRSAFDLVRLCQRPFSSTTESCSVSAAKAVSACSN